MKILISSDTYYPHVNGASYFTQRLAYYLKEQGHDVLVIAPATKFGFENANFNGVRMFGVPSIPVMSFGFRVVIPVLIQSRITQAIKEFNPDVVHLQGHFAVSKKVIKGVQKHNKETPIVGTNHFMPENLVHYLHLPKKLEKIVMDFAWGDFRKVFDPLSAVTTPTESAAHLVRKNGFSQEVHAISCGIDLTRFNPENKDESIRTKYNLPNKPLLLYVGRLDKEKNVDHILQAIKLIPKNVNFHFAIGGKGQEQVRLQKLAAKLDILDRVTFLGFVHDEDLPALYATSKCFTIACMVELQCIVVMEAMASGLPIIAVNALALPELVHDGENGFLFEPADYKTIAEKITLLFTDEKLRTQMGAKSLEIINPHGIKSTIGAFETIYTRVTQK